MHNLCLIILATNTILIDLLRITLQKLHVKLQPHPSSLKDFLSKAGTALGKNAGECRQENADAVQLKSVKYREATNTIS